MPERPFVYISGTVADLRRHRAAVVEACLQQDLLPRIAEDVEAAPAGALEAALRQVGEASLYIAVLAHRYGYVPPGNDRSVTELEFDEAGARGVPRLVFVMDDDHPVRLSDVDRGEPAERLRAFLERCRQEVGVASYKSPEDLREQVMRALIAFRPAPAGMSLDSPQAAARAAYLGAMAEQFRWIDLGGLAPQVGGELLRLPLDSVFIRLHADRDLPRAESAAREEFRLLRELERDGRQPGPEEVARRMDLLAAKSFAEPGSGRTERLDVLAVLKPLRAVVLGDPGAGKSTLLRFVARSLALREPGLVAQLGAEHLPVLVRLGEYDDYCERNGVVGLDEFALIAAGTRKLPLTRELLDEETRAGRCLYLLDGLDEILVTANRASVRDRVQRLARSLAPGCRVLVTSRVVGYRNAELPRGDDGFSHFTLSPFDDDEVRRFAEVWYEAVRTTGESSDLSKQNADALTRGIQANPGVRRLATNPLLMTLIALTYWREVRIPRRRVELYSSASRTLLRSWLGRRNPEFRLDEREATSLLMGLAFHMHLTSSAGLISRSELERVLGAMMTERGLPEDEARRAAVDFITTQEEHVGLLHSRGLNDRDEPVYSFLHLTFEEYFTAREMARLWLQGRFKLTPYLHRPRWEEPVLLAAAHLSDSDDERHADAFVREILAAESGYEDILHRDLLLAARCLADDVVVSRDVSARIFDDLDRAFTTSIAPLNNRILEVLGSMSQGRYEGAAMEVLLNQMRDRSPYVKGSTARALGMMAVPAAWEAVLALLRDPESRVRYAAAEALGALAGAGKAPPGAWVALLALLRDPEVSIRYVAARAMGARGGAGQAPPGAWEALLALLRDAPDYVRSAAAQALGALAGAGQAPPGAGEVVLVLLRDPDDSVRYAAAEALGALADAGQTPPGAWEALLSLLRDPDDPVRYAAAQAAGAARRAARADAARGRGGGPGPAPRPRGLRPLLRGPGSGGAGGRGPGAVRSVGGSPGPPPRPRRVRPLRRGRGARGRGRARARRRPGRGRRSWPCSATPRTPSASPRPRRWGRAGGRGEAPPRGGGGGPWPCSATPMTTSAPSRPGRWG